MPIDLAKLSVLLIEDTIPMRKILQSVLELLGFRKIYTARDGEEGLRVNLQHSPDIIITDWLMEPMDGIDFIRRVRSDASSPNRMVPIILITGYSAAPKVMAARDQGMTEFLAKPFTAKELAARISHVINRPRDFVEAPNFKGPDRRRRSDEGYAGPVKRRRDTKKKS